MYVEKNQLKRDIKLLKFNTKRVLIIFFLLIFLSFQLAVLSIRIQENSLYFEILAVSIC